MCWAEEAREKCLLSGFVFEKALYADLILQLHNALNVIKECKYYYKIYRK